MRRRQNRRIDASRHEPAHTRRGIAADNHLNIRKLHAPLFERQLQREIVGATVVKDVYSLAAKIFGTADLGFGDEGVRKLVVGCRDDLYVGSSDRRGQGTGLRTGGAMSAIARQPRD